MKNPLKVLIVDDDKASAQMLSEVVKRMGFKSVVAHKPVEALNVVRLQTLHAAIVDILLPKMTGAELVEEFRKTKFADQPVVLVSGVFKDKSFAAEAIAKTGAVDFLFKPFDVEELNQSLKKALGNLLSSERWNVQNLLTRKLISDRDRTKAIERLDQMKGLDFPFVLSILMEVGSSGNLNIVNDAGEIFGVSLLNGTIAEVDSSESQSTGVLALISKGYLSQEDWEEYQRRGLKFSLERLVEEGFVSPHAVSDARREQILFDLKAICSAETLQINFVSIEQHETPPRHAVVLRDFLDLLLSSMNEFFQPQYLKNFYSSVLKSPIRLTRPESELNSVWSFEGFQNPGALRIAVQQGGTLEQAMTGDEQAITRAYQCLHYLVLNRSIMFDDLSLVKDQTSMIERYQKLYAELQGRTADKIFEYFGLNNVDNNVLLQLIYEEFVKSNHPDHLGPSAAPELRELCQKTFQLVTEAKNILTDDTAKSALLDELKAKAAEKQQQGTKFMNEGLDLLRKGQAKEAFAKFQAAEKLHTTSRLSYLSVWAEVKAGGVGKPRLVEIAKKIDATPSEDRKSPFYFMAMGLVKRGMGEPAAQQMFEKALQLDSEFVEARRELNAISNAANRNVDKKVNIFQDDISTVVSSIFRRKAE